MKRIIWKHKTLINIKENKEMKGKNKKILSVILAICLVLSCAMVMPYGISKTKNKNIKIVLNKKTFTFNNKVQYPKITVKYKGKKLPKKNYTYTIDGIKQKNIPKKNTYFYGSSAGVVKEYGIVMPGKHTIKVKLKGKYKGKKLRGTKSISYNIVLPNVKLTKSFGFNNSLTDDYAVTFGHIGGYLNHENNKYSIGTRTDSDEPHFKNVSASLVNNTIVSSGTGGFRILENQSKGSIPFMSLQCEIATDSNYTNIVYSKIYNREVDGKYGHSVVSYKNEEYDSIPPVYFRDNTTYYVRLRYINTTNGKLYTSPDWSTYKYQSGSESNVELDDKYTSTVRWEDANNAIFKTDNNKYYIYCKYVDKPINAAGNVKYTRNYGDYCTFYKNNNGKWMISYYDFGDECIYGGWEQMYNPDLSEDEYNKFINSFEETSLNYIIQRVNREYEMRDKSSKSKFKKMLTLPFNYIEPI